MADDPAPGIYSKLREARELVEIMGKTRPNLAETSQRLVERLDDLLTLSPDQLEAERLKLDKAILKMTRAWVILFDEPSAAPATKSVERGGISRLSAKDVMLLVLVGMLLLHGGNGHPTALGEAIESNNLQVVAILIALAAYLRNRD